MMKNKSDLTFYVLTLAGFLIPFVLLLVFKYGSGVASTAGALVASAIYTYAAFWGFSMRNVLAAPINRRQALWVGAAGAYFALQWLLLAAIDPFYPYGGTLQARFLLDTYNDFGYVVIFAWIDATMPLVRESDALLRDEIGWKRLRPALWSLVIIGGVVTAGLQGIAALNGSQYPLIQNLFSTIPYPSLLIGAFGLRLGIKRTTDATLRKQLKWFGLFATFIVLIFLIGHTAHTLGVLPASAALAVQAIQYTMIVLAGVFLFRSAKALVPLSQIPVEVTAKPRQRRP